MPTNNVERNIVEFFRTKSASKSSSLVLYFAGREKCLPGNHFGPAIRAQYLLHFIIGGKGEYHVHGNVYHLTMNQAFLIKPGESTYYLANNDDPWEYVWFAFDGTEVASILQNCGLLGATPVTNYTLDDKLMYAFIDTITQMEMKTENEYALLGNLFHIFGNLTRNRHTTDSDIESINLQHALNFIRNNFQNDIKITDITNYAQVERSYLYRLFMKEIQISPKQYLLQYRLQAATNLLTNSDLNTSEIAYSCGFKDPSAFCKYFHTQTGFTPKKYRAIDGNKTLSFVSPAP